MFIYSSLFFTPLLLQVYDYSLSCKVSTDFTESYENLTIFLPLNHL